MIGTAGGESALELERLERPQIWVSRRDRLVETLLKVTAVWPWRIRGGSIARLSPRPPRLRSVRWPSRSRRSPIALAAGELPRKPRRLASQIGIRHQIIRTEEFADPNYLRNNPDRCYFCKSDLYGRLSGLLGALKVDVIASGANTDDAGDHRPGMRAAGENGVRHPLQECGLSKDDVRALARAWGLPTWDKPATPCLSSRIAYGEAVTPERVRMIDLAEQWLREHEGLRVVRVRYHKGDMARVEVPLDELPRFVEAQIRGDLVKAFRGFGFKYVTLDLEGFRSGSLNALIPLESLQRPSAVKV